MLLSFFGYAQRTMQSASASGAQPLYAPTPRTPTLSVVLGMLARKASQYPGFDSERDYLGGRKVKMENPIAWRVSLQAVSNGPRFEQDSPSNPSRRPPRI